MNPTATCRVERDSLGSLEVPQGALYGVQTQRACDNFPISGRPIGTLPELLEGLALVKKAAAQANLRTGRLPEAKARAIVLACDEIIAGRHADQFPVDVFQGGAGTSSNMNMNEVIANRGSELMGGARGDYTLLHPLDDVNRSQSTNDVYPTALRLAILRAAPSLASALTGLAEAFEAKGRDFAGVMKLGRTQLQDAVPMTLGQEMRAYAVTIREDIQRFEESTALLLEVNLGGTAIGTGIAADPAYRALAVAELARLSGLPLVPSADLVEASWDTGAFVHLSGVLKRIAVKLSKIANDLRLLSSGPRGGLGEIRLPPVQPGSSIMPGKVNPVIPEVVNQVAFHVVGLDAAVTMAAEGGQLQLNPFEPLIAFSLLSAISLLGNAAATLDRRCVRGLAADPETCRRHLEGSSAQVTALVPLIGYERAVELAKAALATGASLRDLLAGLEGVTREAVERALDPASVAGMIE